MTKTIIVCNTQGCEREKAREGKCLHHHIEELNEKMAKIEGINIKINISLWTAIKMRIAGVFKNVKKYEQIGDVVHIEYKEETVIHSGYQPLPPGNE